MLEFRDIRKHFGNIQALDGVSCSLPTASVSILAGPDGAGKSTLLKILVGLLAFDQGEIRLDEKPLGRDHQRLTKICGYMPERFSLYPDLTVEENLNFFAAIHGVPGDQFQKLKSQLLEKTGMSAFRKRKAGALSGGMKQKLALSAVLLSSPRLIVLDEPTTGVDPLSRFEFFSIIDSLKSEGHTILISTPYLDEAEKGDFIIFIKNGRIVRSEAIGTMKKNFPARLFRLTPRGNIFDVMQEINQDPQLAHSVYMRGPFIKYLQSGAVDWKSRIPHTQAVEEAPSLEDIYLYYERANHA